MDFEAKLGGVPFPLVSDEGLEATRAYGVLDEADNRSRRAVFVIDKGGKILHVVPWFQPGNPNQYEEIFVALGFEV
jgi:peroxiredoxin